MVFCFGLYLDYYCRFIGFGLFYNVYFFKGNFDGTQSHPLVKNLVISFFQTYSHFETVKIKNDLMVV